MPAPPGPAKKPAKLPAIRGRQPAPVQPAVPPGPALENWPLRMLAVPPSVYVALVNPTARPLSVACAWLKSTLIVPAEINVPTAPVAESVGRVPPTGTYAT